MKMSSVFTAPSLYPDDPEVCAATVYSTPAETAGMSGSETCRETPVATSHGLHKTSPRLAWQTAGSAAHGGMGLFMNCGSVAPTYQLRGELGRGRYGCVFLVEECVQRHLLAVKAIYNPMPVAASRERKRAQERQHQQSQSTCDCARKVALSPHSPQVADQSAAPLPPQSWSLSNEAMCLQECNSPFIIRLEGTDKGDNGEDLLLMEYVDGGNLRQEIRRRAASATPFTEAEAVFVFVQLCMAVDHLHQRNILHHDLKPENILLSSTGIVKLGDFGFAKKYTDPVCQCVASTGCGTPYYLSPEALRGERYSLKSEMWALGVILYELLALTGPFVAATRSELHAKIQHSNYATLPVFYSDELRSVCHQLLTLTPEHRPSTSDLFHDNEYLREKLNALRRISECSVKMSTEEKGFTFHSISAVLRRRIAPHLKEVAADFNPG
ncbi:hypothetical protein JKF63_00224 [Porcisia hertigi]|uniref:non-specific serine/threonine protein kinase n=1 Tax=Porcisia hertigi TaxID=2761500 RepID=A0A836I7W3_9TRYP|nr:hypothetical protein JKF63_00224 [Porcisia hertigi]